MVSTGVNCGDEFRDAIMSCHSPGLRVLGDSTVTLVPEESLVLGLSGFLFHHSGNRGLFDPDVKLMSCVS
jgi:hypothetical protein